MLLDFEKRAAESNEMITRLTDDLKAPTGKTVRIAGAIEHAMSNSFSIDESL
jgi:hypothetical protein